MSIRSKFALFYPKTPNTTTLKCALLSFLQFSWLKIISLQNKNINFYKSQHINWEQNKPRLDFFQDSGTHSVIILFHFSTLKALQFNRLLVNIYFSVWSVTEVVEQQKIMMVFAFLHLLGLYKKYPPTRYLLNLEVNRNSIIWVDK